MSATNVKRQIEDAARLEGAIDFAVNGIKTDTISESTAGAGVTVDGALIKDGGITTTSTGLFASLAVTGAAAVGTADLLTVGGVIVPQTMIVPFIIGPHATLLTRTLFYAQTDGWTVTGVVANMDLVDDTAITASICKVTGNNVAVAATTPLHTGTINCQTTAGTPQVLTLTSTGADLVLAATNKIGIIFSGAMDVGAISGWIKLKRS